MHDVMSTPPNQLPPVPATPDLFIPQVPFKQLPFPWNDLTNTPQPDATQYYPDHAPSVVATLAGMHPTGQQGQTVNTDGNHALLVKDVSGGGSGVTTLPALGYGTLRTTIVAFGDELFDFGAMSYITGISIAAAIGDWLDLLDTETQVGSVDFKFYNGWGFHSLMIGGYKNGEFFAGTWSAQAYVPFSPPIVVTGNDPDHAYPIAIEVKNNMAFGVITSCSIVGMAV